MTVIPSKYTQYLQRHLPLRRDMRTSTSNTDERDGTDPNRPIPYPNKQVSNNHEELKVLERLQRLLKTFYKRLLNAEKRGNQEQIQMFQNPRIFNHVLKTMVTKRICYIYEKNKTRLLKAQRTPVMVLIGLVDNQYEMVLTNIVLESMYSDMYQEP